MLWNPLRKYILSTFSLKTVFIYYVDIYSVFPFLLVHEYSTDRWVFCQDRKSQVVHTWVIDQDCPWFVWQKQRCWWTCVYVLRAVALCTLILGKTDISGKVILIQLYETQKEQPWVPAWANSETMLWSFILAKFYLKNISLMFCKFMSWYFFHLNFCLFNKCSTKCTFGV